MNHFRMVATIIIGLVSLESDSQPSLFDQQMQIGFEEKQG
jgi:hypothetical protein